MLRYSLVSQDACSVVALRTTFLRLVSAHMKHLCKSINLVNCHGFLGVTGAFGLSLSFGRQSGVVPESGVLTTGTKSFLGRAYAILGSSCLLRACSLG
jgi:hypothetical protein